MQRSGWAVLSTAVKSDSAGVESDTAPRAEVRIATDNAPNLNCPRSEGYAQWSERLIWEEGDREAEEPASFEDRRVVGPESFIVSNFPSWQGEVHPGATFGPAFAGECGTRMHWITRVKAAPGTKIDIADGLRFRLVPNAYLSAAGHADGITFELFRYQEVADGRLPAQVKVVGLDYGDDGTKGTADDVLLTQGVGTANEIISFLPGLAFQAIDHSGDPDRQQAALDEVYRYISNLGAAEKAMPFRSCASFNGGPATCHHMFLVRDREGHGRNVRT